MEIGVQQPMLEDSRMASAEYQRKWRLRNLEKVRDRDHKWKEKRRAELGSEEWLARSAAARKRWREENPERSRELGRAWYHRNKHKPTGLIQYS